MIKYSALKKELKTTLATIGPLFNDAVEEVSHEINRLEDLTSNSSKVVRLADVLSQIECNEPSAATVIQQHLMACSTLKYRWNDYDYIFDSLFFAIRDNLLKGENCALVARAIWTEAGNEGNFGLVRWPSKETLVKERCSAKMASTLLELLNESLANEWNQEQEKNTKALERSRERLERLQKINLEPLETVAQG